MCIDDGSKNSVNWWGILILLGLYVIFLLLTFTVTIIVFEKMGVANASIEAFIAGVSACIGATVSIFFDRIIKYLKL